MPVINRIAGYADEMTTWRRHLHMNPELGFECHDTAAFVAERLRDFGVDELHEGIAKTGMVAIINWQGPGPTIGLRADMDALPVDEATGAEWASTVPGRMHACGHDGHTTMLLGAARYLAETRNFSGRVALLFQPAEEIGGGGKAMVDEGVMDRFGIARVFGIHTNPYSDLGVFGTNPGARLAAVDDFDIHITGTGAHGASPQQGNDPVVVAVSIAQALQTIVSRNHPSAEALVVSLTQIHAGSTHNVIPEKAYLGGTVRTYNPEIQDMVERRMGEIVAGHALAFGVEATLSYNRNCPATINDPAQSAFAAGVARGVSGDDGVDDAVPPEMGAEDFSFMLQARPGAFLDLGQGKGPGLHHPRFDFNDEAAPIGASFFARLVEIAQPPG